MADKVKWDVPSSDDLEPRLAYPYPSQLVGEPPDLEDELGSEHRSSIGSCALSLSPSYGSGKGLQEGEQGRPK